MRFLASWLADISFVRGLPVPLKKINLSGTRVLDLSPLADTDVEVVAAWFTPVADLSALRGKSLTGACFCSTKVSDISMLEGMPLTHAQFHDTGVSDISALSGAPLIQLEVSATGVTDLRPLAGMEIWYLGLPPIEQIEHGLEIVRGMSSLRTINGAPPEDYFRAQDVADLPSHSADSS